MNGFLRANTGPADLVTDAEAKLQARVDGTDEDDAIAIYISSATSLIDGPESMTGRCFGSQTWDYISPCLPRSFVIPVPGAVSVSSVSYYDADDTEQSLAVDTYYRVIPVDSGLLLELKDGASLPVTHRRIDAATFTVSAGGTVPDDIKHAALMLIAHWYNSREAVDTSAASIADLPFAVSCLLDRYRIGWVSA